MKKVILLATAVLFALSLGSAFAADMPAGDIMIDSGNGKKPGVSFSHANHKAKVEKCETCHHKGVDPDPKCSTCHTLDGGDGPKLKDAMHGKKEPGACYTCHLDKENAEKKLKCADCHAK